MHGIKFRRPNVPEWQVIIICNYLQHIEYMEEVAHFLITSEIHVFEYGICILLSLTLALAGYAEIKEN